MFSQGLTLRAEEGEKAAAKATATPEDEKAKALKIKTVAVLPDGSLLLGGKGGIGIWKDGKVTPMEGIPKVQVNGIVPDSQGRTWIATEQEVYLRSKGGEMEKVFPHEVRAIAVDQAGTAFISVGGGVGVKRSSDGGKTWEQVIATLPESMMPLPTPPGDKAKKSD